MSQYLLLIMINVRVVINNMSFSEQINDVKSIQCCNYGCFKIKFISNVDNSMHLRHIFNKIDVISEYGNYGTPKQFLYVFKEMCDYFNIREIKYKLGFKWTKENNVWFNIKCFFYFITNIGWLKDFKI